MKIKIGLADDHQLFLKSLALMLNTLQRFEVVVEAVHGVDLQQKLKMVKELPEIILIDVNMPVMDGGATATWLKQNYPNIYLVALSMNDKDQTIVRMFKAGCCSYLLKDIHPTELEKALIEIYEKGYYNADVCNVNFRRLLSNEEIRPKVTENELRFLNLACSDMTYKSIAMEMNLSERTIDGYRESLFEKFSVQSRVGLCLEALRQEFVKL